MKKILLLLFSLLLLLPVVIYVGNLTDVPASKEIIVYLRNLVGLSAKIDGAINRAERKTPESYEHLGLIESWRTLSMTGFADTVRFLAMPTSHEVWQAIAGDFLKSPLQSAAFFSPAWSFGYSEKGSLKLIGYYQPWIDELLFIRVDEQKGIYKIIAVGMTEAGGAIKANTPSTMAQALTERLKRAEQTFQNTSIKPDNVALMLSPTVVRKVQQTLSQYVSDLRHQLAPTNIDNQTRLAVLDWLEAAQEGKIKAVQELAQASNDWVKQLQAVQLIKVDAEHWLLAAINPNQAERVLLAQLIIKGKEAQATDVQLWDAATAGGAQ